MSTAGTSGALRPRSVSYVLDLTWISDQAGWTLSAGQCGSRWCLQVARTTDGGRSWQHLPTPPGAVPGGCAAVGCVSRIVSHIRFANASIGYLFKPGLFLTRDGGRHWVRQPGLSIEALEPAAGSVLRVAYTHTGCPGPCGRILQQAAPGSARWHTVLNIGTPPADSREDVAQIMRHGQTIYVPVFGDLAAGSGTQHTIILRSLDGGAHWRRLSDPCGGSGQQVHDAVSLASSPGRFLTALCVPRGQAAPTFVLTSTNAGSSWSSALRLPGLPTEPGLIAAADSAHLVVASAPAGRSGAYTYRLLSSHDGGRDWQRTVTDPENVGLRAPSTAYLGFEDATVGRWIAYPDSVWTTRDAGAHWTRQRYP